MERGLEVGGALLEFEVLALKAELGEMHSRQANKNHMLTTVNPLAAQHQAYPSSCI